MCRFNVFFSVIFRTYAMQFLLNSFINFCSVIFINLLMLDSKVIKNMYSYNVGQVVPTKRKLI